MKYTIQITNHQNQGLISNLVSQDYSCRTPRAIANYNSSAQITNYWSGVCRPAGPSATPMHPFGKSSFYYRGAVLWNQLNFDLYQTSDLRSFRTFYKRLYS